MNRSGRAVAALARFYRIEPASILVAHDELDFPAGLCRLKHGGGHGGHNGLRDIISAAGGPGFARLRIGIGHPGEARLVHDYVLKAPSQDDRRRIEDAIDAALAVLPEILHGEWTAAMNRLHAFDASAGEEN
jgi:PTH1 family peptidyl-tRNA hydrolase